MSYENFQATRQRLAAQVDERRAVRHLQSVRALQSKVLTLAQLEAIADMQDGLKVMAGVREQIIRMAAMHRLPLKGLGLGMTGMGQLWYELETMLAESEHAAARLAAGAVEGEAPAEPQHSQDAAA
ncbi:hypothetical protein [Chromobacterium haemolyticum]|uniref:hypothetical protein n=1 Tax=Chromobacterium haemolyticum TaxID=394935 RepID=UPI0005BAC201|nr:hypothetical protein [Chromobacterium haemolyticum]BBH14569.1 hypothetical protein CH06BL_38170 [Chromobacterium haemolyticum]